MDACPWGFASDEETDEADHRAADSMMTSSAGVDEDVPWGFAGDSGSEPTTPAVPPARRVTCDVGIQSSPEEFAPHSFSPPMPAPMPAPAPVPASVPAPVPAPAPAEAESTPHQAMAIPERPVASPEQEEVLQTMKGRATKGEQVNETHSMFAFTGMMTRGIKASAERSQKWALVQKLGVGAASLRLGGDGALEEADFQEASTDKFDMEIKDWASFRFKDYAPHVFHTVRAMFGVTSQRYIASLCGDQPLTQLGTPGKSGMLFYFSADGRFMIKTVTKAECQFFRRILPEYYQHCKDQPNTLICRFFGLHRLKPQNLYIVVMGNVFDTDRVIHERYDLKGSTRGRETSGKQLQDPSVIMKDLDFVNIGRKIQLGPDRKRLFMQQLNVDVQLLVKLRIMDYSLLLGVHNRMAPRPRDSIALTGTRRPMGGERDRGRRGRSMSLAYTEETYTSLFQKDAGGVASLGPDGDAGQHVYFLAVIDILQKFNAKKAMESGIKSRIYSRQAVSCASPEYYAQRFLEFMDQAIE